VREAMQAAQDMEFERIWDLLPSSMQTSINGVFKDFGTQVDAELWDKSFNLLSRSVSVLIAKQEMLYQTPEAQAMLAQMKAKASESGGVDAAAVTPEKIKSMTAPLLGVLTTLLNSELSSTQKLKSFDGRVFCAKTLDPMAGRLKEFSDKMMEEASKIEELQSNPRFQMLLSQAKTQNAFDGVTIRAESSEGDLAVVVIERQGLPAQKLNFVRVDGKWVPEQMGRGFPMALAIGKAMLPNYIAQINAQKASIMPALAQIEPLVAAMEKAGTQEEFNTAFTNFYSQTPQLIASAAGMPGLSAQFGGGAVKVSPVKVDLRVTGPMTDAQLGKVIEQLEALTDDPGHAITLPVGPADGTGQAIGRSSGSISLKITPVNDPKAFSEAINFAEAVEFDADSKTVVVSLKFEPPPQPAETSEPKNSVKKR